MGDVVELAGFRQQRREMEASIAALKQPAGDPLIEAAAAEFIRRTLATFEAVQTSIQVLQVPGVPSAAAVAIAKSAADQVEKAQAPLIGILRGHLLLALIEIEWMRVKRSLLPDDLRMIFEAILAPPPSTAGNA